MTFNLDVHEQGLVGPRPQLAAAGDSLSSFHLHKFPDEVRIWNLPGSRDRNVTTRTLLRQQRPLLTHVQPPRL